jgi:hypothetical protein
VVLSTRRQPGRVAAAGGGIIDPMELIERGHRNMQCKNRLHLLWPLCGFCFLAATFELGCSRSFHNAPVNASRARETLRAALESWKQGDQVDALQGDDPPIYVVDMDWQAGVKLAAYQIVNDGQEKDAQLFCPVKLTLRDPRGKETSKQVIYMIATAPNLVVSRKVF